MVRFSCRSQPSEENFRSDCLRNYGKEAFISYIDFMTLCCGILTIETSDCFFRSFCFTGSYLKKHSYNLHTLICGIFCPHSVDVARYAALIRAKSPTNYDVHLAESLFQTRSDKMEHPAQRNKINIGDNGFFR